MLFQTIEDLFGKIDCRRCHRGGSALNAGFGANLFRDLKGLLEGLIEFTACMFVLECDLVGLLELAKDFRFTQHHGIKSAGDAEQVSNPFASGETIDFIAQWTVERALFGKAPFDLVDQVRICCFVRHVDLHSITG